MKRTIQVVLAAAATSGAAAIGAQAAAPEYALKIERAPLRVAMLEFSSQTGLQVAVLSQPNDPGRELLVGPLDGNYTADLALAEITAGHGLLYSRINESTFAITQSESPQSTKVVKLAQVSPPTIDDSRTAGPTERTRDRARTSRGDVEEVIVTARKREEALSDVPMSVNVVSDVELSKLGIVDAGGLFGRVPNVYFTSDGGNGPSSDYYYLVIRGVGFNAGQETAVGVFVDGMYQPSLGYDIGFLNLERLEVLRGPQGTLFGRNTQGGALNLVTKKPGEDAEGQVEVEGGSLGTYRALGSMSGPLGETLFGGLSGEYATSDGFIRNVTTGGEHDYFDRTSVRGTLRWVPSDTLEFTVSADASQKDFNDQGYSQPFDKPCCQALDEQPVEDEKDNHGAALTMNWALSDAITLTSISGVRVSQSDITWDLDGVRSGLEAVSIGPVPGTTLPLAQSVTNFSGSNYHNEFEQTYYSQELRLAGSGDVVNWLAGAYYFGQEQDERYTVLLGPGFVSPVLQEIGFLPLQSESVNELNRDGYAFFGQGSWKINEKIELTAGGRYSYENVSVESETYDVLGSIDVINGPTFRDRETDFSDFSPMASVSYHWNEDLLTYFTVSQGWKSGGFARLGPAPGWNFAFDSEDTVNWEIGTKAETDSLSANVALFYIDIRQQQLQATTQNPVSGLFDAVIDNAGSSRSYGVEFDGRAQLSDRLNVSLSVGYTSTEIEEYVSSENIDFAGRSFPFVPEWTASINLDYVWPLNSDLALEFHVDDTFVDSYTQLRDTFGNVYEIPSYDRANVHVSLLSEPGKWQITGYVRNIFDSFDYTSRADNAFARDTPIAQEFKTGVLPPRTYGVKLAKRF